MQKLIPVLIILTVGLSCKSQEKSSQSNNAMDSVLLASIERTPCFGKCPTYKISIYQSGYVLYEGKQNVKNIGVFSLRLEKQKIEEIKKYILQNKILEMNEDYKNPHIADYPIVFTEANLDGKFKHIVEADPKAPKEIKDYQNFLDSFFTDETKWIPLKSVNEK